MLFVSDDGLVCSFRNPFPPVLIVGPPQYSHRRKSSATSFRHSFLEVQLHNCLADFIFQLGIFLCGLVRTGARFSWIAGNIDWCSPTAERSRWFVGSSRMRALWRGTGGLSWRHCGNVDSITAEDRAESILDTVRIWLVGYFALVWWSTGLSCPARSQKMVWRGPNSLIFHPNAARTRLTPRLSASGTVSLSWLSFAAPAHGRRVL